MDKLKPVGTPSASLSESESRPARARRRPARFDDGDVSTSQQPSQTSRYTVDALPEHSQTEYVGVEKTWRLDLPKGLVTGRPPSIYPGIDQKRLEELDEYYSKTWEVALVYSSSRSSPKP